jgi:hypothetical protein
MNGWSTLEKSSTLCALVLATRPKVVCEIGVYAGRSFLPMAMACKYLNHGHCIGIDSYDPIASSENENEANALWWQKLNYPLILSEFHTHVATLGLGQFITLHQKRSNDVEPPPEIDIFHCDGSHAEQAITDVKRFAPKVVLGGYVILDDLHWSSNAVSGAADWLLNNGFQMKYSVVKPAAAKDLPCDDWGVLVRVK